MDGFTCPLCKKEACILSLFKQKDVLNVKMFGIVQESVKSKTGQNIKKYV